MKTIKFSDINSGTSYTTIFMDDFERINPVSHLFNGFFNVSMLLLSRNSSIRRLNLPKEILNELLLEKILINWKTKYSEILARSYPPVLNELLECNSKKEQLKLFKDIVLTSKQMEAFIVNAYLKYNFLFSQYKSTHYSKSYSSQDFPSVIHKQDNEIYKIGHTTLSDGQLKQIVDQQSVKVFKFLDKGDTWHCFFLTFKSLNGEEKSYKNGQPHLHYISDKWGLSRQYVIDQLKAKDYKLPSLPHIDYHTHRNPLDNEIHTK